MIYLNYALCVVALACLIAEVYLIIRMNRKVEVRGADDFFTFALVLLFVVIIFPISEDSVVLTAMRNTLMLLALLGTLAVRRGVSDQGVVKLGYVIDWAKVNKVTIDEHLTTKIMVVFMTDKRNYKLIFNKYKLRDLLREMEKHMDRKNILVKESLDAVIKMKRK